MVEARYLPEKEVVDLLLERPVTQAEPYVQWVRMAVGSERSEIISSDSGEDSDDAWERLRPGLRSELLDRSGRNVDRQKEAGGFYLDDADDFLLFSPASPLAEIQLPLFLSSALTDIGELRDAYAILRRIAPPATSAKEKDHMFGRVWHFVEAAEWQESALEQAGWPLSPTTGKPSQQTDEGTKPVELIPEATRLLYGFLEEAWRRRSGRWSPRAPKELMEPIAEALRWFAPRSELDYKRLAGYVRREPISERPPPRR